MFLSLCWFGVIQKPNEAVLAIDLARSLYLPFTNVFIRLAELSAGWVST